MIDLHELIHGKTVSYVSREHGMADLYLEFSDGTQMEINHYTGEDDAKCLSLIIVGHDGVVHSERRCIKTGTGGGRFTHGADGT